MKLTLHKAESRGHFDHGWLKTWHSFSFGRYVDRDKVHFGALRVLNDDIVQAGMGFGKHPHDNMEIVTIPLSGTVGHEDSTGNKGTIEPGEVQIMSAGTGIFHSEMNHNRHEDLNLLQIWVLPKEQNIAPRYDQKTFGLEGREGKWQTVVAPDNTGESMWINQDSWFNLTRIKSGQAIEYKLHNAAHGAYLFVISGSVHVAGQTLEIKDGLGIENMENISIYGESDAEVLLIEVPMLKMEY